MFTSYQMAQYIKDNGMYICIDIQKEAIHGKGRFYLLDKSYLECYSVENKPTGKVRLIK